MTSITSIVSFIFHGVCTIRWSFSIIICPEEEKKKIAMWKLEVGSIHIELNLKVEKDRYARKFKTKGYA